METFIFFIVAISSFGIVGNTLVIASILKRKILLKKNYYFLVLHLAICDVFTMLSIFLHLILDNFLKSALILFNCLDINDIYFFFQVSGVCIMMLISVLRYRAIVCPLKLSLSQLKIKIVCGLAYIIGLVTTVGMTIRECILESMDPKRLRYFYELSAFYACFYILPIIFMSVTYSIIARTLSKQRKVLRTFSNASQSRLKSFTSSSLRRHNQDRKTFFVCVCTVLCFAVGHIYYLVANEFKNHIVFSPNASTNLKIAFSVRILGSHSLNPLIYGLLDRKIMCILVRMLNKNRRNSSDSRYQKVFVQ